MNPYFNNNKRLSQFHASFQIITLQKKGRKFHTKSSGFSSSHIAPGFWWLLHSSISGKIAA